MNTQDETHIAKYIKKFFGGISNDPITIRTPYPKGNHPTILDYTGIVGISGDKEGSIYLTASGAFLEKLADAMFGIIDMRDEDILDGG